MAIQTLAKRWRLAGLVLLVAAMSMFSASQGATPAQADPHTGQSVKVAVVSGPGVINGGTLPTSGADFAAFSFFSTSVASVGLTALTDGTICGGVKCDTVVLNVASSGMSCRTTGLTAAQKADLNTFVANGGKMIIYDSECTFGGAVDYTWLTYPFSTNNPGAAGSFGGVLTIAEENILSTSTPADPHYINTAAITSGTDAVGDMNVVNLATVDPNWCLDMTGTNVNQFSGAVHMYARSGTGLYLYNGMDVDFMSSAVGTSGGGQLAKIWLQELQSAATLLPCGITVVGITISPLTAENLVGQAHTVTATLTDLLGSPQTGVLVDFEVTTGPNAGQVSDPDTGECTADTLCTTDAAGAVSWTYTGTGGVGTDEIVACFTNPAGAQICSQTATKKWIVSTTASATASSVIHLADHTPLPCLAAGCGAQVGSAGDVVHDKATVTSSNLAITPTGTVTFAWFVGNRHCSAKGPTSKESVAISGSGGVATAESTNTAPLAAGDYSYKVIYFPDAAAKAAGFKVTPANCEQLIVKPAQTPS